MHHTWEGANFLATISTLVNKGAGWMQHMGRLSNAVSCLDFLKCVYFLPRFQPPITPLRMELQATDVCLPSPVQPISVVSVSQLQTEICVETHQLPSCTTRTICTAKQILHFRQFILTLKSLGQGEGGGGFLPCPFATPLISITHYMMKFSWTALAGCESCNVIFTGYCYRICKGGFMAFVLQVKTRSVLPKINHVTAERHWQFLLPVTVLGDYYMNWKTPIPQKKYLFIYFVVLCP